MREHVFSFLVLCKLLLSLLPFDANEDSHAHLMQPWPPKSHIHTSICSEVTEYKINTRKHYSDAAIYEQGKGAHHKKVMSLDALLLKLQKLS